MDIMESLMKGESAESAILPAELIQRASTAAPPAEPSA